jgi:hypothetical protein
VITFATLLICETVKWLIGEWMSGSPHRGRRIQNEPEKIFDLTISPPLLIIITATEIMRTCDSEVVANTSLLAKQF